MTEWTINVFYGAKSHPLRAVLEYHSSQIIRIRVYGMKGSVLLECDYPLISKSYLKKGITWKIREGAIGNKPGAKEARFLADIIKNLESILKTEFK